MSKVSPSASMAFSCVNLATEPGTVDGVGFGASCGKATVFSCFGTGCCSEWIFWVADWGGGARRFSLLCAFSSRSAAARRVWIDSCGVLDTITVLGAGFSLAVTVP